ncbi:OLC1v1023985C1 [Oldenlandia corymbosa var. corymbosa]|uniref:OLC1v1023985C1 n=1 Tax=Oldenlandia corymbosa var. corymbosa TaxID=529605 RepID=A0AAV1C1M7_OLDCO|nr:OLC1v1023985C1 [Oldenlandia corymbosa var. corymbosa]
MVGCRKKLPQMTTLTMAKNLLRCFASSSSSSSLNPVCKNKPIRVRNGEIGTISAYFFCTGTDTTTKPSSPPLSVDENTLFRRLMGAIHPRNPNRKAPSQVLKQWVDEGREIDIRVVFDSVKLFRKMGRYRHALEISEWIRSISNPNYRIGSAIHLDLIYKVHGLEQAERYFESTPDDSKDPHLYRFLLNCYVLEKLLDKAEAIMQKMRELGDADNLSYNRMLTLYSQMRESIKMISLVREMENKGMNLDSFTYRILLNAYGSTSDVMGMEKLLMKMEADPLVVMGWNSYSISANGYLKAGDIAKAASMLKKCEHKIKDEERRGLRSSEVGHAYEVIMTQYASMGNKDEVYRIWKLHKKPKRWLNKSYTCMISSLLKLDDTVGAHKLFDEWFSRSVFFDIRIPNLLLAALCTKGQVEEAELIVKKLLERGNEPNARTWHYMASGYVKKYQMEDVKWTMNGLRKNPRRRPDIPVFASCFEYLEGKGDNCAAEESLGLLERVKSSADLKDLISKYMRKGDSSVLAQIENESARLEEKL